MLPTRDTESVSHPRPPGRKAAKDKGKRATTSSESMESIQVAMQRHLNMETGRVDALKVYMDTKVKLHEERERKKEERERKKEIYKKKKLAIKLMEMDVTAMTESQRRLHERQMQEVLDDE
ncbi:hypothetical protein LINPERPRIM_LOCUS19047 [Linum perenne]